MLFHKVKIAWHILGPERSSVRLDRKCAGEGARSALKDARETSPWKALQALGKE